jgi:predicted nucleic acid-binding protein
MNRSRILLDTAFIQATLNPRDQHHRVASGLYPKLRGVEFWITECVMLEVLDAMSALDRPSAIQFARRCYSGEDVQLVRVDSALLGRGLDLYESHRDERWSLTDCVSFVVMREHGIDAALTADRHFVQAGFRALMLEED